MTCYYPLPCFRGAINMTTFKMKMVVLERNERNLAIYPLRVPCGNCLGCRISRSRQWAIRCVHEMKSHKSNSFITLTYSPEHCPSDMNLDVRAFQLFMKRLRKHLVDEFYRTLRAKFLKRFSVRLMRLYANRKIPKIRFFHCGEYGPKLGRPHYHAIIFGYDFPDKVFYKVSPSGEDLYRSALLEKLWPFGYSTVGEATYHSAAYVARYILKKVNGEQAEQHYSSVDLDTGEFSMRKPEYITMSRRPGIGKDYFDKYMSDMYPSDEIVIPGKGLFKPPRYYDGLYEVVDPVDFERLKEARVASSKERAFDNTPSRLEVRRKVKESKISRLYRDLN